MTITAADNTQQAAVAVDDKKRVQAVVTAHRQAGYKCVQCRGVLKTDKTLCGACRGVFYCSKECQVIHWRSNHKIACQLYRHILSKSTTDDLPFTFPLRVKPSKYDEWLEARQVLDKGLWRRDSQASSAYAYGQLPAVSQEEAWTLPTSALPAPLCKPLAAGQAEFPEEPLTNWAAYYAFRQLPKDSPVAVLLSLPLTIYYAITQCLPEKYRKRKELRIHLLGAERELDQTAVLAELANLIPEVKFHITLIGPMVHADMTAEDPHPRVRLSFRRGHYHELCQQTGNKKLHPADLAIAPNASLETNQNWRGTVHLLAQQKVPSFFTDQCETSTLNATRLFATVGAREAFPVRLNPFRSPVWREAEVHAMPCYSNGFLQAINV
ncbi:hypothetical protein THASP1DRAFT_29739 [Thamnocephalis sphaerospora]|uniref:MYND-type domain-containing protein n=1 Tax=Thamnocephalis sphaerospora TaxID=78915 RepID=A0A4P9XQY3_9FUNG|nr:hypothetical protein THASP1DRAFT_29739 [Thamnocephalis sphaerospora]|eukprot:RKP08458.1 hypothetical protein THASP1DRAFT_29739 [Thamnocephalis sphaerospora]